MSKKLHKKRDHIATQGVAKNRSEIYKKALKKYKVSIEQGFYIEATAICESLITDRMESRIGELCKKDVYFGNLGELKKVLVNYLETDEGLLEIYKYILDKWAPKRNKIIHQIVKISQAGKKDWDKFMAEAKQTAEEGMAIFRELDKLLTKVRKNTKK